MNSDAARISARISEEYKLFREFQSALQLEQAALIQGEPDELLPLAARKAEIFQQLSSFGAERERQLASAGFENSAAGMRAWFDAVGADTATREKWQELLELAREAEHLNQSNGKLIETHLRHNQQALAVLHAAANPASLYGRNGHISTVGIGGQSRDKA